MLEVHDWPEAIVGDLVVLEEGDDLTSKYEKEKSAMEHICAGLPYGKEVLSIWNRFETSADSLAQLAREINKYQAVKKAFEYEKKYGIKVFEEFYTYEKNRKFIKHTELQRRMDVLMQEYQNL